MAGVGTTASKQEGTTSTEEQLDFRAKLQELYEGSPLSKEELMFNLGMYTRSSLLVKFLVMNDLYERIKGIPGVLMEFGVWWGQNLVLLENLRAIHEPFNKQRCIVGFDTFAGYDQQADIVAGEKYETPEGYKEHLAELLEVHEGNNAFGHVRGNHQLIEGDVEQTVPQYFKDHPEAIVAMAYFDIGVYQPTRAALQAIKSHLVPGSVLLFDELTWPGAPGEAIAFKEEFKGVSYRIEKSKYYPSKAIVMVNG